MYGTCGDEDTSSTINTSQLPFSPSLFFGHRELACEAQKRKGRLGPTFSAGNGNLFLEVEIASMPFDSLPEL
jgi:transcriptional regulator of acetoin/glycerol metabolism